MLNEAQVNRLLNLGFTETQNLFKDGRRIFVKKISDYSLYVDPKCQYTIVLKYPEISEEDLDALKNYFTYLKEVINELNHTRDTSQK